jgi:uncharacterized protein (DUF58 family)
MSSPLLTPLLLSRLERLEIVTRKIFRGELKGQRRSKRKGESVEFADYRNYAPGDDLRRLDWNLYARLDKLIMKLFQEEENLHFYLLVDTSQSMDFGQPTKLDHAKQLAAALGFIGLVRSEHVWIETVGQEASKRSLGFRGRHSVQRMLRQIEEIDVASPIPLATGIKNFSLRHSGRGVVVLISDLMDKQGYQQVLRMLASHRFDSYVVQVLSQEELDPNLHGDMKLVDCEDQQEEEITVSADLLSRYRRGLTAWTGELQNYCTHRGIHAMQVSNQMPIETLVGDLLRCQGLVRGRGR